jgi:hypothetical protein
METCLWLLEQGWTSEKNDEDTLDHYIKAKNIAV